jgi:fructose-1,6-bisphosphatase I
LPQGRPTKAFTLRDALAKEDTTLSKTVELLADLSLVISNGIPSRLGVSKGKNVYGEEQKKLDVWANDLLVTKLLKSGLVKEVGSEELDQPRSAKRGELTATIDPIDGSSNVESDNPLGTIVGLYRKPLPAKGRDLLCSMYFNYGPYIALILALPDGVHSFVAAGTGKGSNRFVSTGETIHLPEPGQVYGIGGLKNKWTPRVKGFVETLEQRGLKLRYSGSFTGDVNQIVHYGGVFAYPELTDAPNGKLRLQFESNPVAYIIEKAGGLGSTGSGRILDVEPTAISQRTPTYIGNEDLIKELENLPRP